MTKAIFKQNGNIFRVKFEGHAEFNPGNDIVCAACSVLMCALYNNLIDYANAGLIKVIESKRDEKTGFLYIRFKAKDGVAGYIEAAVKVIARGFELLKAEYPDNVDFIYVQS